MSLKDTINNTNTQKENIKTVATQIDNKLVELGGEQATDLSDVPNKMEGMVNTQYVKIAEGTYNQDINVIDTVDGGYESLMETDVSIPLNLKFEPKRVILYCESFGMKHISSYAYTTFIKLSLDSKNNYNRETSIGFDDRRSETEEILRYRYRVYIKNISRTSIEISFIHINRRNTSSLGGLLLNNPIKWTAIG